MQSICGLNKTLQKFQQPSMHQKTSAWLWPECPGAPDPAAAGGVCNLCGVKHTQMIAANLRLQRKRKYFLISDHLIQICTSSTTVMRTAKQLNSVVRWKQILLNFSISPSGKVCINIEKLRAYEWLPVILRWEAERMNQALTKYEHCRQQMWDRWFPSFTYKSESPLLSKEIFATELLQVGWPCGWQI